MGDCILILNQNILQIGNQEKEVIDGKFCVCFKVVWSSAICK